MDAITQKKHRRTIINGRRRAHELRGQKDGEDQRARVLDGVKSARDALAEVGMLTTGIDIRADKPAISTMAK
jgi:hypothetical protein